VILEACFWLVVVAHHALLWVNAAAVFWLPLNEPLFVAAPLVTFIGWLTFSRADCPLTRLENWLRERTGRRRIGGFVGHYYRRPFQRGGA
jgi:hypothetical protein